MATATRIAQVVHSGRRVKKQAKRALITIKYNWVTLGWDLQNIPNIPTTIKFQTKKVNVIQSSGQLFVFHKTLSFSHKLKKHELESIRNE